MGKKNRNKSHTPSPGELLGKTSTPVAEVAEPTGEVATEEPEEVIEPVEEAAIAPEAVEEATAPAEVTVLEQMVANLPEELREKALAEITKLQVQAARNVAAKAFVAFDSALKDEEFGLPKFIGELAKTHGVDLTSRRITITYPDGKFAYTNSPKGSKTSGNGGRTGFPTSWGTATLAGKDGKAVQTEASPSKLAEKLSLQVEGMRDMVDVFENPHERGSKAVLPKIYKVDAVRGEYFRVTITK